jgi:hypothetical protein
LIELRAGSQLLSSIVALFVATFLMGGCDSSVPSWPPADSYVTVFESETEIPQEPRTVMLSDASVKGSVANVCLALGSGTPAPHTKEQLKAEVGQFLNESTVSVFATTAQGEELEFCGPSFGWTREGKFAGENELSVCYQASCSGETVEVGTGVVSVTVSASPPLKVLGAYWESTNAYDTP